MWLAATLEGMVALQGLLAALEPLARPHGAADDRSGPQRRADALTELARRNLEGGQLPQTGGVRPQLIVTVDLDSLLGRPGAVGGEAGWAGPLSPEACRRLACDGALTRVLVTRAHGGQHGDPGEHDDPGGHAHGDEPDGDHGHLHGEGRLGDWLQAAHRAHPPHRRHPTAA